jgi:predicted DNA-binding transcriptional regulator AlpA
MGGDANHFAVKLKPSATALKEFQLMEALPNQLVQLLNEHTVAKLLGVSVATVRRWRLLRQGPRFIKVGAASVRYRQEDVRAYVEQCPAFGESSKKDR